MSHCNVYILLVIKGGLIHFSSFLVLPSAHFRVSLVAAPPASLPEVLSTPGSCSRCYVKRECMMYAKTEQSASASPINTRLDKTHGKLLKHFTGHLNEDAMTYFRDWDHLIDLEADASSHSPAEAWLVNSVEREKVSGKCISSLVFDEIGSMVINTPAPGSSQNNLAGFLNSTAVIRLQRASNSVLSTPLSNLKIEKGSHVIISTDATTVNLTSTQSSTAENERPHTQPRVFRHQMHVLRGVLEHIDETSVQIRSSCGEMEQVKQLVLNYREQQKGSSLNFGKKSGTPDDGDRLQFRIDKDEISTGTGTLRQNLINLFTSDAYPFLLESGKKRLSNGSAQCEMVSASNTENNPLRRRMSWLRDAVVRLRPPAFNQSLVSCMFEGVPEMLHSDLVVEFKELNSDQQSAVEKVKSP